MIGALGRQTELRPALPNPMRMRRGWGVGSAIWMMGGKVFCRPADFRKMQKPARWKRAVPNEHWDRRLR